MDLRVWKLEEASGDIKQGSTKRQKLDADSMYSDDEEETNDDEMGLLTCTKMGSIKRQGRGRVSNLLIYPKGLYLGCHGNDNHLELYKINSDEQATKMLAKRQKKARKRARDAGDNEESVAAGLSLAVSDEIPRLGAVKMSSKIRNFDLMQDKENGLQVNYNFC